MAQSAPVEAKVKAAGVASLLAAFVVGWLVVKVPALTGMADPLQAAIVGAVTGVSGTVAGWLARHTPRPPVAADRASERARGM